mgnify:FL=1
MAETDKLSPNRFRLSLARMLFFALVAALLFSAGLFVPILGFWCLLMSPLPLALLGMREGLRWQTTGTALAGGAILLTSGPFSALYFLIGQGPLAYALSLSPRGRGTGAEALLLCSGVSVVSKLALLGVFLALTGQNPLMPDPEQVRLLLTRLYAELPLEGEQTLAIRDAVEEAVALFPYMLPPLVLISSVLDAFINYRLGVFYQRGRVSVPSALPPFSEWRFSRTLLPAMFLAFFMELFTSDWVPGAMFAMNLKLVLGFFFFLQGLSLLWWWFAWRRVGLFWRCLALAVLALPLLWIWLVVLGVGDMLFDLRRRASERRG